MTLPAWVVAASAQAALVVLAAGILARLFRPRHPRAMLAFWQSVLLLILILPAVEPRQTEATISKASLLVPGVMTIAPAAPQRGEVNRESFSQALAAIAACGVVLRLAWLGLGLARLRTYRRRAKRPTFMPWSMEHACELTGIRAEILASADVAAPVTFGLVRPVVLLPESLPPDESMLEAVVCHELLHVRRRDWLFRIAEEAVRAVAWFHPAVWWILDRIELAREQVIDLEVVALTKARRPYLEAILTFAGGGLAPCPTFLRTRHVKERVELLLREKVMSRIGTAVSLASMVLLLTPVGICAVRMFPIQGSAARPDGPEHEAVRSAARIRVIPEMQSARLVFAPKPLTPPEASHTESVVRIWVVVGVDGAVQSATPVSGHPALIPAALEAVRQYRYAPAAVEGEPVEVETEVSVPFSAGAPAEQAPREPVFRVGAGVTAPVPVRKVEPQYSQEAHDAGFEGTCVARAVIAQDGRVSEIEIIKSPGMGLDEKVAEALAQWRFQPGTRNGRVVAVHATIEMNFRLK